MRQLIDRVIENIPDYKKFMTVDEMNKASLQLAEDYPEVVSPFDFGTSRQGENIIGLKIGTGSKNALIFGLPHPNEPIGAMLLDHFSKELATNKVLRDTLDYTWYIVKAWDVDGTRLNEGWFKGPFSIYNYARNFFRPAGHQQVDWTFPIKYKQLDFTDTIPETKAMMDLIDEIKPKFIYSLHNAGFGGVYWYLTHDISEIYNDMREAAKKQEVPINYGEPEAPFCTELAPAIYKELGIEDNYDYLEKYGIEDITQVINVGTCSADYAKKKYNSFTMLTELPYFFNSSIDDLEESSMNRGALVREKIEHNKSQEKIIKDSLAKTSQYMKENNPFRLALESFTNTTSDHEATIKMTYEDEDYQKYATNAEVFDNRWVSKFYNTLSIGLLIRANESTLEEMNDQDEDYPQKRQALIEQMQFAEQKLKDDCNYLEENLDYHVIPIKKLIAIQLECGLLAAYHLSENPI